MGTTWKSVERSIARLFGGRRTGPRGIAVADVADHRYQSWLAIEIKHRKKLPQWILDALKQAELAAGEHKLAMVVLHERRMRYKDSLVVLRLSDWIDWFEGNDVQRATETDVENIRRR